MSISAVVLCNNVLMRAFHENVPVSPMKLQKLLYFISCEYLKRTKEELLSEAFSVWQYGPVLPTVYNEFKSFSSFSITEYAKDAAGESYALDEDTAPNLKLIIDLIWQTFRNFTGVELSEITHRDGSGWSRAYEAGRKKISTDDMEADHTYERYFTPNRRASSKAGHTN